MSDPNILPGQQAQPYGPLVDFSNGATGLPSRVYVTEDDTFRVRSWAPTGNQTIRLTLRFLNPQGVVIPIQQTIQVVANGLTPQVNIFNGDEGFLLSVSIDGDATQVGMCFVQLCVQRGVGSGDSALGDVLCQGYVSIYNMLCFPQSPLVGSVQGRGNMRIASGAQPAIGLEVLQVVPAGRHWILRAASVQFAASAVAGNRQPALFVDDGGAAAVAHMPNSVVTVGQNVICSWGAGNTQATALGINSAGLTFELRLLPGWRIQTATNGILGGDQYGTPRFLIEEFVSQ